VQNAVDAAASPTGSSLDGSVVAPQKPDDEADAMVIVAQQRPQPGSNA